MAELPPVDGVAGPVDVAPVDRRPIFVDLSEALASHGAVAHPCPPQVVKAHEGRLWCWALLLAGHEIGEGEAEGDEKDRHVASVSTRRSDVKP